MPSIVFKVFIMSSLVVTLLACGKDGGSQRQAGKVLFGGKPVVKTVDDFNLENGDDAIPTGLASDKNFYLWACGNIKSKNQKSRAIVRTSAAVGDENTWKITSDSQGPNNEGAENLAIAADGSGNVYVAQNYISHSLSVASILYSTDWGATWKNADFLTPNTNAYLKSVSLSPQGVPFFSGYTEDASHKKQGLVLTLKNNSAVLAGTASAPLNLILGTGPTSFLTAGFLSDHITPEWVFLNEGTLDSVPKTDLDPVRVTNLGVVDALMIKTEDGTIYAGGTGKDTKTWTTKTSRDGVNFADSDAFQAQFKEFWYSTLYDFNGYPMAAGGGRDEFGQSHWIVRFADPLNRWQSLASFNEGTLADVSARVVGLAAIVGSQQLAILGKSHDSKGYHWKMRRVYERAFNPR